MLSSIKQKTKKLDMFSTTEMLRYKEEPEYATLTGACISVVIFALIGLLVYQMIIVTISKDQINWSRHITKEVKPGFNNISLSQMKFGIEIFGANLNDPSVSYYDIVMIKISATDAVYSAQYMTLQQCKIEDWSDTQQLRDTFERLDGTRWLCPNYTQSARVGGKYSTEIDYIAIEARTCGSVYTNKTNCANQTQMDELLNANNGIIYLDIYALNTLLQPEEFKATTTYIEDTYYLTMGSNNGMMLEVDIADYTIETDSSLLPFQSVQAERGVYLNGNRRTYSIQNNFDTHGSFLFLKSPNKEKYVRSFLKVDETLSYAGGLVGVILGLFFIMSPYTQLCYEISLANQLFQRKDRRPLKHSLNFIKYIGFQFYSLISYCCSCHKSQQFQELSICSEQVKKQLDIAYLIKRIASLEKAITREHKLKLAYERVTVEQAEERTSEFNSNSSQSEQDSRAVLDDGVVENHSKMNSDVKSNQHFEFEFNNQSINTRNGINNLHNLEVKPRSSELSEMEMNGQSGKSARAARRRPKTGRQRQTQGRIIQKDEDYTPKDDEIVFRL